MALPSWVLKEIRNHPEKTYMTESHREQRFMNSGNQYRDVRISDSDVERIAASVARILRG